MSKPAPDPEPRFVRGESGRTIIDTDFMHDALMKIDGDFGTDAERIAYADGLLSLLNAEAARADLLADAMRYRWLRDKADPDKGEPYVSIHKCNSWGNWFNTHEYCEALDAAIDAAMKGQE